MENDMSSIAKTPAGRGNLKSDMPTIIRPAVQVGCLSGLCGLFFGGVSGVLRTTTPLLFALGAGVQWFTLGATFWGARAIFLQKSGLERRTSSDTVSASALAGGISGGASGLLRGARNVLPGAIVFAMLGGLGQAASDLFEARRQSSLDTADSHKRKSWMDSKWSPVTALSDSDYESMLQERLLRVNAEIALVDEGIQALRAGSQSSLPERQGDMGKREDEKT